LTWGLFFAFMSSVSWGVAPILQKRAVAGADGLSMVEMNAARAAGLIVCLVPMTFLVPGLGLSTQLYTVLLLLALVNNVVGDVLAFVAIRDIGVSLTSPITSTYVLMMTAASWLWFEEALTPFVVLGTVGVVIGIALLTSGKSTGAVKRRAHGIAAAAAAAVCWAVGLSLGKYLTAAGVDSIVIIYWRCLMFSVAAIAIWGVERTTGRRSSASLSSFGAGAAAGVVALVIGGWCYFTSLTLIPMNVATPVSSTSPLIAALIACLFGSERLRPAQWVGIGLIVAGAAAVNAG
jgi:DME family drug/metabolite transporter